MCTINTERLILRRWTIDDTDDYYEFAKSPKLRDADMKPIESVDKAKEVVKHLSKSNEIWAIVLKEDSKVIGSIGLHKDPKRKACGCKGVEYAINHDYWGNGYCTEAVRAIMNYAFMELGILLISACHYPHNIASKRVMEKCGMTFAGIIRRGSQIYDGTVYDSWSYSITKEEFALGN